MELAPPRRRMLMPSIAQTAFRHTEPGSQQRLQTVLAENPLDVRLVAKNRPEARAKRNDQRFVTLRVAIGH